MRFVQRYEWGTIEWITDQSRTSPDMVDIGVTTILPGKSQEKHMHYGDSQWLYVISGTGVSRVNGAEVAMEPGAGLYIPSGAIHETSNTGQVPLVEMLVSYPSQVESLHYVTKPAYASEQGLVGVSSEMAFALDDEHLEVVRHFGETLALPITIYDTQGQVLYGADRFPDACRRLCGIHEDLMNCHLYEKGHFYHSPAFSEQSAHYCKYGVAVIDTPIIHNRQMVGMIRGGHISAANDGDQMHPALKQAAMNSFNLPKGRLRIILSQYKRLGDYLAGAAVSRQAKKPLDTPAESSAGGTDMKALREDLDLALTKILNLQINNHFLFNTFNAIAALALDEGAGKTYEAVLSLSKLFRYSVRSQHGFVTLEEELEHAKNYLELQRLRFGDRLSVHVDVESETLGYCIPLNTLQPLLENAFIHGFRNTGGKMAVRIRVTGKQDGIRICVSDNGDGVTEEARKRILRSISGPLRQRRGLALVVDRLKLLFGGDFHYSIETSPGNGYITCIQIPRFSFGERIIG